MRSTSIRALALSTAAGLMAFGFTALMPATASAASAERAAISSTIDTAQPTEMQRRRGGFRGGPRFAGRPGFRPGPGPYRGRGRGIGPGAAIGIGAAALIIGGAAAAASANSYRECWVERRWVDTYYGPELRRVRVCN
ncbi:hypothetical protein [Phreatobacter sp.]|uniref:hypothetical protein n=1 Tax=Phreatobacter sp. TaxID=1966341 RepID=UPI0022BFE077|nr:hypothetical protein [Phreatobacter sp.]MCZ8315287.1 hypothetical protein [Phreatobacter sp.]